MDIERSRVEQEDVCNLTPMVVTSPKSATRSKLPTMLLSSMIDPRQEWQWTEADPPRSRRFAQGTLSSQDNIGASSHPLVSQELVSQAPFGHTVVREVFPPTPRLTPPTIMVTYQQTIPGGIETSMQPIQGHRETQAPAIPISTPATPGWSISSDDERMNELSLLNGMQARYEWTVKVLNGDPIKADTPPRPDVEIPEVSQLIKSIRRSELEYCTTDPFGIVNTKTLVSYSSVKNDAQTILVPGTHSHG